VNPSDLISSAKSLRRSFSPIIVSTAWSHPSLWPIADLFSGSSVQRDRKRRLMACCNENHRARRLGGFFV
jgi:hypothetical protein